MTANIECYTAVKPPRPRLALAFSIMLLAIVSLLAGGMTWTRSMRVFAARIQLPELGVSLRPPIGFLEGDAVNTRLGPARPFYLKTADGAEVSLVVRRVAVRPGENAQGVCKRVIAELAEPLPLWSLPFARRTVRGTESTLGGLPAVEAVDEKANSIHRAAVHPTKHATVVSLEIREGSLDEAVYRLFDRTCASVEFLDE